MLGQVVAPTAVTGSSDHWNISGIVGNAGALSILGWYLWYQTSVAAPRQLDKFSAEQHKTREAHASEQEELRTAHAAEQDKLRQHDASERDKTRATFHAAIDKVTGEGSRRMFDDVMRHIKEEKRNNPNG